jgi:hypothetical protein
MRVSGVPYEVNLPPEEDNGMKPLSKTFSFAMAYDDTGNNGHTIGGFPSKMHVTKTFTIEEAASWPEILAEFCDFMASCYGYDIREKIVLDTYFEEKRFRWLPDELQTELADDYDTELAEELKDVRAQQDC